MSAKAEARDLAYRVWRECGQNLSKTERKLNRDHGLPVTRQTLAEWREKYGWEGRAARVEAATAEQAEATGEEAILSSLLEQKTRYEEYFATLPPGKVDNQALFAYSRLLKTIVELRQSMAERKTRAIREELAKLTTEFAGKPQKEAVESLINIAMAVAATGMIDGSVPIKVNLAQLMKALPGDPDEGKSESQSQIPDAARIKEIREKFL